MRYILQKWLESRLPLRKSGGGETLHDTISMEAILEMPVIKVSKRSKRTVNQEIRKHKG